METQIKKAGTPREAIDERVGERRTAKGASNG